MPPTDAFSGYGARILRGDGGSPEVFTPFALVFRIKPPTPKSSEIKVSNLESPGQFDEFIRGMRDGGNASFSLHMPKTTGLDANLQIMFADYAAGTNRNYRIIVNNVPQTKCTYLAYLDTVDPEEITTESAVAFAVTQRVSGEPVWSQ